MEKNQHKLPMYCNDCKHFNSNFLENSRIQCYCKCPEFIYGCEQEIYRELGIYKKGSKIHRPSLCPLQH